MPESDLITIIREQAEKERAKIESDARTEADTILKDAQETADTLREQARVKVRAEAERIRERKYNSVRFRMNAKRYELKASAIERLWSDAFKAVTEIVRSNRYSRVLEALFSERLDDIPDGSVVKVNPDDMDTVEELIRKSGRNLKLEQDEAVFGGVEFHWPDKRIAVRNSLRHRLEKLKAEGNEEIVALLFPETEHGQS